MVRRYRRTIFFESQVQMEAAPNYSLACLHLRIVSMPLTKANCVTCENKYAICGS